MYSAVVGCQEGPTRIETVSSINTNKNNNENNNIYDKSQQQKDETKLIGGDEENDENEEFKFKENLNKSIEEDVIF